MWFLKVRFIGIVCFLILIIIDVFMNDYGYFYNLYSIILFVLLLINLFWSRKLYYIAKQYNDDSNLVTFISTCINVTDDDIGLKRINAFKNFLLINYITLLYVSIFILITYCMGLTHMWVVLILEVPLAISLKNCFICYDKSSIISREIIEKIDK